MKNINPTNTQAWKALKAHQSQLAHTTIADLFKQEENRFNDYSLTFENQILVDFSKNKINRRPPPFGGGAGIIYKNSQQAEKKPLSLRISEHFKAFL